MSQKIKSSEPALTADEEVPVTPSLVRGVAAILAALKTLNGSPGVYRMIDAEDHPLYVGKAQNLRVRCNAHLNKSGFKKRFESYAREEKFPFTETKNLLLVTIKTEIVAERDAEIKDLVEEILKLVGRPPYGIV